MTHKTVKELFASDIHRRIEEVIKVDQAEEKGTDLPPTLKLISGTKPSALDVGFITLIRTFNALCPAPFTSPRAQANHVPKLGRNFLLKRRGNPRPSKRSPNCLHRYPSLQRAH